MVYKAMVLVFTTVPISEGRLLNCFFEYSIYGHDFPNLVDELGVLGLASFNRGYIGRKGSERDPQT